MCSRQRLEDSSLSVFDAAAASAAALATCARSYSITYTERVDNVVDCNEHGQNDHKIARSEEGRDTTTRDETAFFYTSSAR